jgi:hypothetical protein
MTATSRALNRPRRGRDLYPAAFGRCPRPPGIPPGPTSGRRQGRSSSPPADGLGRSGVDWRRWGLHLDPGSGRMVPVTRVGRSALRAAAPAGRGRSRTNPPPSWAVGYSERITRAGLPTATTLAGRSLTTTTPTPDHRVLPDADPRTHDHPTAQPDIVANAAGLGRLPLGPARLGLHRMGRGQELDAWADLHVVADPNRGPPGCPRASCPSWPGGRPGHPA